mmetsp:Transcript_11150/g.25276  ORF Transcript_11150/g.25276 Transcript_11150/m.25276 type:complete len:245 (+) Transcript_11150:2091-2825(+)
MFSSAKSKLSAFHLRPHLRSCLSVEGEEVDRWAGLVEEDRPVVVHKEAGPFRACATARLVQLSCRPAEVVSLDGDADGRVLHVRCVAWRELADGRFGVGVGQAEVVGIDVLRAHRGLVAVAPGLTEEGVLSKQLHRGSTTIHQRLVCCVSNLHLNPMLESNPRRHHTVHILLDRRAVTDCWKKNFTRKDPSEVDVHIIIVNLLGRPDDGEVSGIPDFDLSARHCEVAVDAKNAGPREAVLGHPD